MAHDDALTILSESPLFIPSLVALLADLSTALWEEEPALMTSHEMLSECVSFHCPLFLSNDTTRHIGRSPGSRKACSSCTTSSTARPRTP